MATGNVDVDDNYSATDSLNHQTNGFLSHTETGNNLEHCLDGLISLPNGNCTETNADSDGIRYMSTSDNLITSKTTSIKRRSPVRSKPNFVQVKSQQEDTSNCGCLEDDNVSDCSKTNTRNDCSNSTNGPVDTNCVRKRQSRNSRDMRNSAGASGGIFTEEYQPDFGEFLEKDDVENEEEMVTEAVAIEPLASPVEQGVMADYSDIDRHNIVTIGGDDKNARRAIVFSSCRLPPKTEIDHQRLFQYMMHTLDQYVENDYSVVYFHHGLNSKNKPSISWLIQVYHALDRK